MLLDILGEPTTAPIKVYGLDDVLESGKHTGKTVKEVVSTDWKWIKWAACDSEYLYFDIDAIIEEREKTIKRLQPEDLLPFGKYKGKTIKYVYENDESYLAWLMKNTNDFIIDIDALLNSE